MATSQKCELICKIVFTACLVFLFPIRALALPGAIQARAVPEVRLIQYVQTFTQQGDPSKQLSLLPLAQEKLPITHVILAALHVNAAAGDITLNDLDPAAEFYQSVWSDVKVLQQHGIKVLVMLGGAARGSYAGRLCRASGEGLVSGTKYKESKIADLTMSRTTAITSHW